MAKADTYNPGDKIKVDGVLAIVLDVLSSQLFVEFQDGRAGVQDFIIIKNHRIEVE